MLVFEPFSIKTLKKALPYIRKNSIPCSDLSAGSLVMWGIDKDLRFCQWNDTLVIRQNIGDQPAFSWPIGADPYGIIDELQKYTQISHLPLRFFAIDAQTLKKIQNDERLKYSMWSYDAKWSDYIYSFEETKTFKGRKYNGQRNHMNKFKKLYGEPNIRFLTPDDLPAVEKMLAEYRLEHPDANQIEHIELEQTKKLLSVYEWCEMYAVGLFVDNQIAAFTIGEIVGDMLVINVEKALRRYKGAYPTIYSGFVRLMDTVSESPLRIIN